jgi:glycine/D-amino acid oxidase-like deaminating enzyme
MSTSAGDIEAEVIVNCAGMWARSVGRMAGVNDGAESDLVAAQSRRRAPLPSRSCIWHKRSFAHHVKVMLSTQVQRCQCKTGPVGRA